MLAHWWEDPTLIYWIVGVVALYFLGTPLLILFGQKLAARPACKELKMHSLEPALAQFIMDKTNALFQLGFDEPTLIHLPNPSPGVMGYLVMLINRDQGDKAMVTALVSEVDAAVQTWYVEFSTRYQNDQCVDTLNSAEISAFPTSPQVIRTQTPSVTDVDELYRLHQYQMKNSGISVKKVVYEPGQAITYLLEKAFKQSYEQQVARGWLRYDAADDAYRPTVIGAYLMTWGLLQPMKMFSVMRMRQRERVILSAFRKES